MAMLTKATVVGAGAMGTIMAELLASNHVRVALLALRPERAQELLQTRENRRYLPGLMLSSNVRPTSDVAGAIANSELIITAVPCQHLRDAVARCAPHVASGAPVCSVTKGIENRTLKRPTEIIADYLPHNALAALSGPSIAPELARRLPATVVVAAAAPETCQLLQSTLSTSWFRVYTSRDLVGVELAGAVKNVIALAAGILDGLQAGDNAKSALVTRGLVEITRLGAALGARPDTFVGLAGVGDLVTTCISPVGRNRSAGERIGRGVPVDAVLRESPSVIEGIPTTRSVVELAARHQIEMPITQAVHDILFSGKDPLAALTELMSRPPKRE
ncbi:MAG: Glycerol-3-phosphate dehydrogenase [NAD(P)+] [Phycisphaerae bacterium]|nr:Glycerol-3-phosphate dehydrogenase [NAD(P)+] [Phycisphaerae bacterium]